MGVTYSALTNVSTNPLPVRAGPAPTSPEIRTTHPIVRILQKEQTGKYVHWPNLYVFDNDSPTSMGGHKLALAPA